MKKNVASQVIGVQMVSATDGSAFTGVVTVAVTGDGGTQATGSVGSGACTHEGNGFHTYAPAQAETNYDHIAFTFTGTGAIPATVQVFPAFPQTGDTFARVGAPAGASVSADVAAVKTDTAAILLDTAEIGAAGAGLTEAGGTGDHLTALAWNAAWDAEVQSEVADALVAYDPPTHAELIAEVDAAQADIAALNDPTAAAVADAVWDEARAGHVTAGSFGEGVASVQGDVTGNVAGSVGSVTGAVGSVTGAVGSVGAGGITAASFGAGAIDAAAVATDAAEEIADTFLGRAIAGGSNTGRLVRDALRRLRNRVGIAAGTMTVYQENDTSSAWSAAVTTTAGDPISDVDPA